jgi:hypothetical protein
MISCMCYEGCMFMTSCMCCLMMHVPLQCICYADACTIILACSICMISWMCIVFLCLHGMLTLQNGCFNAQILPTPQLCRFERWNVSDEMINKAKTDYVAVSGPEAAGKREPLKKTGLAASICAFLDAHARSWSPGVPCRRPAEHDSLGKFQARWPFLLPCW